MPAREAGFLALLAIAGDSYCEIAERKGVTYTNVNKHLARASRRTSRCARGGETAGAGP